MRVTLIEKINLHWNFISHISQDSALPEVYTCTNYLEFIRKNGMLHFRLFRHGKEKASFVTIK